MKENSVLLIAHNAFAEDGVVRLATNEEILAQPCVQEALKRARIEGFDDRFRGERVSPRIEELREQFPNPGTQTVRFVRRIEELREQFPNPGTQTVRFVRRIAFEGTYENVIGQIARSLEAGRHGHIVTVNVEDGGIMPWRR